jgi:hypothetical protein
MYTDTVYTFSKPGSMLIEEDFAEIIPKAGAVLLKLQNGEDKKVDQRIHVHKNDELYWTACSFTKRVPVKPPQCM